MEEEQQLKSKQLSIVDLGQDEQTAFFTMHGKYEFAAHWQTRAEQVSSILKNLLHEGIARFAL